MLKEALELHNNLNPAIWTKDETLLPEVEDRLFKIVNKFQSECYLPLDIVDVHLVGSNASFNYNSQSDLDVHIVVNFDLIDANKEILMVAYNLQKAKFNQDYDISIHGVNVEMYIEDINSMTASNGIYSLYNKKWIKKPVKKSYPTLDKRFYDTLDRLANKLRKVVSSDDEVEITRNINMLYMMRKNGLATDGEFSVGNLLFKEIRNLGLLDELKKRLKEVQSEKLTLEQINEDILFENRDWFAFKFGGDWKLVFASGIKGAGNAICKLLGMNTTDDNIDSVVKKYNPTLMNQKGLDAIVKTTGKSIDELAIGSWDRQGRKETHDVVFDKNTSISTVLNAFGYKKNECLIHHLDDNDTNTNLKNLCIIPYQLSTKEDGKQCANGIHNILHAINYDPKTNNNHSLLFISLEDPAHPTPHYVDIN